MQTIISTLNQDEQIKQKYMKIKKIRACRKRERGGGVYEEDEAIRARAKEVEVVKEMSGEVGDGFDFRFEEKPAPFQTFLQLRFLQKVPLLELQTNPHALHGRLTSVRE